MPRLRLCALASLLLAITAGCGSCHALAAAGSEGIVGPDLDEVSSDADRVAEVVTNGLNEMPAFGNQLSDEEIAALSAYVSESAAP